MARATIDIAAEDVRRLGCDGGGLTLRDDVFTINFNRRSMTSPEQYRAALARIADAINEHLDATAPKPEPIKVGDRVAVRDYGHDGKVRAIDEQFNTALVTFDNRLWDWCALERLTKVPA